MESVIFCIFAAFLALIFALFFSQIIIKKEVKNKKAKTISEEIFKGAMTFLNKEYQILAIFVLIIVIILLVFIGSRTALAFLMGSLFSALAGNIGMRIATKANIRVAEAVQKKLSLGFRISFLSGSVMGLSVVGLGILGVSLFYLVYKDPVIIYGFGFGASLVALFARVGGGIYTKAADIGADLAGKVEAGIPEDDIRNPASIADNVGDNVGDVAGMGADLFESYVDAIIAAMVLGMTFFSISENEKAILFPLLLAAFGVIASLIGNIFVRVKKEGEISKALNKGIFSSSLMMVLFAFLLSYYFFGFLDIFYAVLAGLFAGVLIGLVTEYYTSSRFKPTREISKNALAGAGPNIIGGLATGMQSTAIPVLIVAAAILIAYFFGGVYGIAIAAVGLLSTLGITLAVDTYGPVADNAAGIAEMSKMGPKTRRRAEALDTVGNTTSAIGKGFAISSAALTAIVLLVSYIKISEINGINIGEPKVMVGLFIGGVLPFIFSAFLIKAVGRAATLMVQEVRRQFKEIKGLLDGKARPETEKAVAISTNAALKEMIVPGILAVATPLLVGFLLGKESLGALLGGSIVTGFLMAIMMANSGGAWDNAKKYIEKGNLGGRGSDAHKAAVVGDIVGDPLKDTAGPSLNILIKLISIISLIIAPLL